MAAEAPRGVPDKPQTPAQGSEIARPGGASLDVLPVRAPIPTKDNRVYGGYGDIMKRVYLGPPGGGLPEDVTVTLTDKPQWPLIDKRQEWLRPSALTPEFIEGQQVPSPSPDTADGSAVQQPPDESDRAFEEALIWKKYDAGNNGIITWIGKRNPKSAARVNEHTIADMASGKIPVPDDPEIKDVVDQYKVSKRAGRAAFADYYEKIAS